MPELRDKYPLTNIYVLDSELYGWAKQKAYEMGYKSVSELIFDLFQLLKENHSVDSKLFEVTLVRQMRKVKLSGVMKELRETITELLKTENEQPLSDFQDEISNGNEHIQKK